jgi:aspartate/methionine/tyrosine aminotransferase
MKYRRMPIEVESPEELGYGSIQYNLSESSVWDAHFGDWSAELDDLVLCYGEHRGKAALRDAIAATYGASPEDVLVVPGASAALFIVNTSLLEAGSSLVVARPNYATNIETPRLLPCSVKYLDLKFENKFDLDMDELAALITPETRLVSVTYPHNPTGAVLSESKLRELIEMVETRNCCLLVDETYRDLHRGPCPPLAATLSSNVISVSSLSKAFGLPGIRSYENCFWPARSKSSSAIR